MGLRAAVLASLPAALLGAKPAPGCGCEVSHCCETFDLGNSSESLANVFNGSNMGVSVTRDMGNFTPACSLLGLIPGAFDSQGSCSAALAAMENTTVCEAVEASAEASERVQKGAAVMSVFVEPGTCEELGEEGGCWDSRAGQAAYMWTSADIRPPATSWCTGSAAVTSPALAWSMTCPSDGDVILRAGWVDNAASTTTTASTTASTTKGSDMTDGGDMNGSRRMVAVGDHVLGRTVGEGVCDADYYPGGIEATVAADDWKAGPAGSPRWVCFNVPRGALGQVDSRVLAYSIGDLPCGAADKDEDDQDKASVLSGSPRSSVAVLASVAPLVAAVAAVQ